MGGLFYDVRAASVMLVAFLYGHERAFSSEEGTVSYV